MKLLFCCIGDELFSGYTIDTNSNDIFNILKQYGIETVKKVIIRDTITEIVQILESSKDVYDITICIGGLGPTFDDVTLEAVNSFTHKPILNDTDTENKITARFKKAGITDESLIKKNLRQARYIESLLENNTGLSIGSFIHCENNKTILLLPGPPNECIPMFLNHALPHLIDKYSLLIQSIEKTLLIYNASESYIDSLIESLSLKTVKGIYAKGYFISLVLSASDESEILHDIKTLQSYENINSSILFQYTIPDTLEKMISLKNLDLDLNYFISNDFNSFIDDYLANCFNKQDIFEFKRNTAMVISGSTPLEYTLAMLLKRFNKTISFAESCTGGLVSSMLSAISGISSFYKGSVIAYSNDIKKSQLHINEKTLDAFGAVSKETAYEMAYNIRTLMNTDIGISITGIAGPGGGTPEKPVGLVFIGISTEKSTNVFKHSFFGNRKAVQNASAAFAFLHGIFSFVES